MENKYKKLFYASLIIIIILIGFVFWNMSKSTNLNTTNSDKSVTKENPKEKEEKKEKFELTGGINLDDILDLSVFPLKSDDSIIATYEFTDLVPKEIDVMSEFSNKELTTNDGNPYTLSCRAKDLDKDYYECTIKMEKYGLHMSKEYCLAGCDVIPRAMITNEYIVIQYHGNNGSGGNMQIISRKSGLMIAHVNNLAAAFNPNEENKETIKVEIIDNKVHFIVWNAEISNHNENSGYYFMQYYIYDLKKENFEFKRFINGMPAGLT